MTLEILGLPYEVEHIEDLVDEDGTAALGLCLPGECKIMVRAGIPPAVESATLLHEILHAIDADLDIGLSEKQVIRLTTGLRQSGCRGPWQST